jgi:hypothetical protein
MKSEFEKCGICENELLMPSKHKICDNKTHIVIDGKLKQGECMHIFHEDCMKSDIELCPICKTPWILRNILNSNNK